MQHVFKSLRNFWLSLGFDFYRWAPAPPREAFTALILTFKHTATWKWDDRRQMDGHKSPGSWMGTGKRVCFYDRTHKISVFKNVARLMQVLQRTTGISAAETFLHQHQCQLCQIHPQLEGHQTSFHWSWGMSRNSRNQTEWGARVCTHTHERQSDRLRN